MPAPKPPLSNQRMFHGTIQAGALADQLAARFNDRQHHACVHRNVDSALVQMGSQHGTPVTIHIADIEGGVLVTMSRDRDWLDRTGDVSQLIERAGSNPFSFLALIPDVIGEFRQDNLLPQLWNAVNDMMALSRSLAGEEDAPLNPKRCPYCGIANDAHLTQCTSCGGPLPVDLPRRCPKCGRMHTSDALFCQACGTRLVEG